MLLNYFVGFTVFFYCWQRRPYWSDHRRPYWKFQCRHTNEEGILSFNSYPGNTFRPSTLSRKCQSSHFPFCNATVLLRWSLQYGRRWLQFPNNRCSIQSYFSDQWMKRVYWAPVRKGRKKTQHWKPALVIKCRHRQYLFRNVRFSRAGNLNGALKYK